MAQDDLVILKRIIAAYKKTRVSQKSAGEAFNVSNEWLSIYERNLGPVMKALLSENIAELQRMYQNFFRDLCSTGLLGLPINIPNVFSGGAMKQQFRKYILCMYSFRNARECLRGTSATARRRKRRSAASMHSVSSGLSTLKLEQTSRSRSHAKP